MVYEKQDTRTTCRLKFTYCTFVDKEKTGDFTITKRFIELIIDKTSVEDIVGFLQDRNIPGDDIVHNELAHEIITNPPQQGYLTISNALQWRLQYSRVITLEVLKTMIGARKKYLETSNFRMVL